MSKNNHSKSELFLMEFIVIILFFSICASICISAFVKANNISEESKLLNGAMILAQSTAEEVKATSDRIGLKYKGYEDDNYYMEVSTDVQEKMLVANIVVYDVNNIENEICRIQVKKYLPDEV